MIEAQEQSRLIDQMLRITGLETCEQILKFLDFNHNIGKIDEDSKLTRYEFCTQPGAWYWRNTGTFDQSEYCLVGNHKRGIPPRVEVALEQKKERQPLHNTPVCPDHGVKMIVRNGPHGEFWGCPKYPDCRKRFPK